MKSFSSLFPIVYKRYNKLIDVLTICYSSTVNSAVGWAALVVHFVKCQRLRVCWKRGKISWFLSFSFSENMWEGGELNQICRIRGVESLIWLKFGSRKFASELSEERRRKYQVLSQIGFGNTLDGNRISFYISHCWFKWCTEQSIYFRPI